MSEDSLLTYFSKEQINGIPLPKKFTFPFFYEPHHLTRIAVAELQNYLEYHLQIEHNFGLNPNQEGLAIGKMFGVLVVQDTTGNIGYLSAFSGKLAGSNQHPKFVPPVFDMLVENSFFLKEEEIINRINHQIEIIYSDARFNQLQADLEQAKASCESEITQLKTIVKHNKADRKKNRLNQKERLSVTEYEVLEAELVKQSLRDKHQLNVLTQNWKAILSDLEQQITVFQTKIEALKQERKQKSAALQKQLFEQYSFLDSKANSKSLYDIFKETVFGKPPAAAGECATPKLLQYAFLKGYKPLAMAEFWWGVSPKSEIRKHKQFYPACRGKCEPILKHMLEGIELEENPFLINTSEGKTFTVVYEDQSLIVVNKPSDFLSVPGIHVQDSVYTRLQALYPNIAIIHRLDMATSGLLVLAKTKEAHKHIQKQFLKKLVKKRYTALLDGWLKEEGGEINLPLRGDVDDRPRQLVCFEWGKKAQTKFEVIERKDTTTKVYFYPITGRTHQLRVHAAHTLGLNLPIKGDDLYGSPSDRLYLHAAYLEFTHPYTHQLVSFEVKEDF